MIEGVYRIKAPILEGPKILGKIELNPANVRKNKNVWDHYLHFSERLKERYNLTISKKEYYKLSSRTDFTLIRVQNNVTKAKIIYINFKYTKIRAAKGKGGLLTTALPISKSK